MADIFRFKQFAVEQTGCAMKVNTDGVLLGALAEAGASQTILDIGTGTGVIALMLAQRFAGAKIDAVEIDATVAETAKKNFAGSVFAKRLQLLAGDYKFHLDQQPERKYDCIVSNPPFYLQSLKSPQLQKTLAKHTDATFFEDLIQYVAKHLSPGGKCWLILPSGTAALVKEMALGNRLFVNHIITIRSFKEDEPHRQILALASTAVDPVVSELVIYDAPQTYSPHYQQVLKDFLIIF